MATTMGARALGLDPSRFELREGQPLAGLASVEIDESRGTPLSALDSRAPARLVALGTA
jgi:hypothetical protein